MQSIISLNILPFETIVKIVNKRDMKAVIQVNRSWHATLFQYIKNNDSKILKKIAKFICSHLDRKKVEKAL